MSINVTLINKIFSLPYFF